MVVASLVRSGRHANKTIKVELSLETRDLALSKETFEKENEGWKRCQEIEPKEHKRSESEIHFFRNLQRQNLVDKLILLLYNEAATVGVPTCDVGQVLLFELGQHLPKNWENDNVRRVPETRTITNKFCAYIVKADGKTSTGWRRRRFLVALRSRRQHIRVIGIVILRLGRYRKVDACGWSCHRVAFDDCTYFVVAERKK